MFTGKRGQMAAAPPIGRIANNSKMFTAIGSSVINKGKSILGARAQRKRQKQWQKDTNPSLSIKQKGESLKQKAEALPGKIIDAPGQILRAPAWSLKIISAIAISFILVILILLGIWIFLNLANTGAGGSVLKHGQVAIQESPLQAGLRKVSPTLYNLVIPGNAGAIFTEYSFESEVVNNKNNRNLGVKVESFEQYRPVLEGEDIEVLATLKGASLDQETEITVWCYLEDYNDIYQEGNLIPATLTGTNALGNKAIIPEGDTSTIQASCYFPGGVKIDRAISTKEAKLVVLFDFKTKALYEFSYLNNQELASISSQDEDPFEVYPFLPQPRRSITTAGPINLGIGSKFEQPFTDAGTRRFDLSLTNGADWRGHLKLLKGLEVSVPSLPEFTMVLEGEQGFPQQSITSRCAFEATGLEEDGFKTYKLKQALLDRVNQDCDLSAVKDSSLSQLQCFDIYKEPTYGCIFAIEDIPPQAGGSDFILANAEYTYQIDSSTTVDITKQPGSFGVEEPSASV